MNARRNDQLVNEDPDVECGQCGSLRVTATEESDVFLYGTGDNAVELTAQVPVFTCADCGFQFTNEEAEFKRHGAVCSHLGVLTPAEVREIRRRTGLSRDDFAARTGLGVASLARWENGQLIQSASHDNYLRLLAYPENLERLARKLVDAPRGNRARVISLDEHVARRAFPSLAAGGRLSLCASAAETFHLRRASSG